MTMTKKQRETIAQNLSAFIHNFGPIRFERADYGPGFFIYYPANAADYMHFAPSIDYLDGWLYGAVQAVHRIQPLYEKVSVNAMCGDCPRYNVDCNGTKVKAWTNCLMKEQTKKEGVTNAKD